MDTSAVIKEIGFWFWLGVLGLLVIEFTLLHIVAKAARMKNRSYLAFYWLSFVFRSGIIWLIVASLPFNHYDPRAPFTDKNPDEPIAERYVNEWSLKPLVTTANRVLIGLGLASVAIALIGGLSSLNAASNTASNFSSSDFSSNQSDTGSNISSTTSGCKVDLTSKQILAGYTDGGSCLAWRWTTNSEDDKLSCSQFACAHAYLFAMDDCAIPILSATFSDSSGNTVASDSVSGTRMSTGEKQLIEVGTAQTDSWQTASISNAYCSGTD